MANKTGSESVKLPAESVEKVRKIVKKHIPKTTICGVIVAAIDKYAKEKR